MKTKLAIIASLFAANSAYATVELYSGANNCALDSKLEAAAFTKHANAVGNLEALTQKHSEQAGATGNGYFIFNPAYLRTDRYFNCSVPLNANIGQFTLTVHGTTKGLTGTNAFCSISRIRKVSDGGIDKWFKFKTGKAFYWTDISDPNVAEEQFVSYTTMLDNNYESGAVLDLKCRTTWDKGSVAVGQIELSY
ncbi:MULTISPECIES: hypothetical protein [Pseudoalteromonas]|uniref:Uncharacterized protein n=1 Tax=Pseudoalteromonas maricaloris TaxID=184924 RepID=A0A8I2H259_9GAMM|nr:MULTISPECIES: hypothetical protein [Pseudoalteromonas]NLR20950.1 hypothetical protein [Pseudoalteromonas maricaloris]RZG12074.1 hypothetical protein EXT47_22530 [Pseudoalteromonas sp. CO342X]WOX30811.1 hypothetical protein R5H13_23310 [Pseudoalteromonas maricaloris]